MIPTGYTSEPIWSLLMGLLLALVLGGCGVGLLFRAFWRWLAGRTQAVRG